MQEEVQIYFSLYIASLNGGERDEDTNLVGF